MTDPLLAAARGAVRSGFATLRRVADGLPPEALNWRPAGPETNSIAVLATHAAASTRLLLHLALGLPDPERDRDAEFAAVAADAPSLLGVVEGLAADCEAAFEAARPLDWAEPRRRTRSDGEVVEVTAAHLLVQAVEHLRGHADEASLTRHVWSARGA